MLENVQRRATKSIPGLSGLSYEERLRKTNIPTLAYRRIRGDMIETYKILTEKYDPEVNNFIKLREDSYGLMEFFTIKCSGSRNSEFFRERIR